MACQTSATASTNDPIVGPFRASFAIGSADRFAEYRLRYDVFVEEYGFEPARADRLERDEFDDASCSLLLRDAISNDIAASQRLILPDRLPPGMLTNLERLYRPLPDRPPIDFTTMRRDSWAEASRTTVAKRYRWGSSETSLPAMVAIKYASIALAIAFGRPRLFSLSELRTARLIRRLGFAMVQVGAPVEFHGWRAPFQMDVASMLGSVAATDHDVVARLTEVARLLPGARHSCGF
jgi:N-acyl-L-homoserine lactone synthetase